MNVLVVGIPQSGSTALYNIIKCYLDFNNIEHENFLYKAYKNDPFPRRDKNVVNDAYLRNVKDPRWKGARITETVLMKEHHYNEFLSGWADIIFLCRRDIRDSIASRRRRGKTLISKGKIMSETTISQKTAVPEKIYEPKKYDPNTFYGFKKWCEYLTKDCFIDWTYKGSVNYIWEYEKYKKDPLNIIKEIGAGLGFDSCELTVAKIYHTISNLDESNVDKTFYTRDKITAEGKVHNFSNELSEEELNYIEENYSSWIYEEEVE